MKTGVRGRLVERDPWFDRLTILSEAEGESRELAEDQVILDPPPKAAGDDKLRHSLWKVGNVKGCHSSTLRKAGHPGMFCKPSGPI